MVKNHLKRIAMPSSWKLGRKTNKFIQRPNPGAHSMETSMPLGVILRDLLKVARTFKEVKHLLTKKDVFVDGRKRNDPRLPVGVMDIVSLPELKKHYRVTINKMGSIVLAEIKEKESNLKVSKIMDKRLVKGKMQLQLSDGRNILVEKGDYHTNDTLLLELPSQKISAQFKLEPGALIFLVGGKHIGETGKVENISGQKLIFKSANGSVYETLKKYALVIGKDAAMITVGGG